MKSKIKVHKQKREGSFRKILPTGLRSLDSLCLQRMRTRTQKTIRLNNVNVISFERMGFSHDECEVIMWSRRVGLRRVMNSRKSTFLLLSPKKVQRMRRSSLFSTKEKLAVVGFGREFAKNENVDSRPRLCVQLSIIYF